VGQFGNLRDLVDEPGIDPRGARHLVHRVAVAEGRLDQLDAVLRRNAQPLQEPGGLRRGILGLQVGALSLQRTHRLPQGFLERPAHRHHLAHRLHLGGETRVGIGELLERPPRHLDHHVVEGRLEARGGLAGDVVRDLVQPVADRQPRGDLGDGEPGGLAGQRRGPRHPRVHLDQNHPPGGGVHRELDVGSSGLHAHGSDACQCGIPHLLILPIGERLRRSHGDRVPRVHAHRVYVLDRAHDHGIVGGVAHHLELEFFPPRDRLLHQDLADGTGRDALGRHPAELFLVVGQPASSTTQHVRGPDHHREAEGLRGGRRRVDGAGERRSGERKARLLHDPDEHRALLGAADGRHACPEELHAVRIEGGRLRQRDGDVERRLPPEGGKERIRPFPLDDGEHRLGCERFDVGAVREFRIGHDRGRVGIDQDDPEALLPEHLARLCPRVVELARLTDDDGSGPDDEDGGHIAAARHYERSMSSMNRANRYPES
jgi:hypothetical protein